MKPDYLADMLDSPSPAARKSAVNAFAELRPGQRTIMQSFARHGLDSVYVASDIMDLRLCSVLTGKGLLQPVPDIPCGYELTETSRATLAAEVSP